MRQFWPLTVTRTAFCGAPVFAELLDVALSEEKRRALSITAAWLAVDRWNYIINGLCLTASRTGDPCDSMSAICA